MIQGSRNSKSFDVIVLGGGVMGLWAARHARAGGAKVLLLEKRQIGSGASGGFLGALMPHMPDNWNAKKQFQFEGLSCLSATIRELEAEIGIPCGYRRCGRRIPITHEKTLPQVERRIEGARANWKGDFGLQIVSDGEGTQLFQHDTLSARINPRAYLNALTVSLKDRVEIEEGVDVTQIGETPRNGWVRLSDGSVLQADRVVVANGYEAYALVQPYFDGLNDGKTAGRGVKGQAVLLSHRHGDDYPIFYHDGTYIIPHGNNRVAVGSTSLNEWEGRDTFDSDDMDFLDKALSWAPHLQGSEIIEKWAAVRPRNTLEGRGTEPWFGFLPGSKHLFGLLGGFKISLGIAHLASRPLSH